MRWCVLAILSFSAAACAEQSLFEGTVGALDSGEATSSSGGDESSSDGEASTGRTTETSSSGEAEASSSSEGGTDEPDPLAGKRVAVEPGPTKDAELVSRLPIARSQAEATRKVVLRLGPDRLPQLRAGDRLVVMAEVQVTTRCDLGQTAAGCDYDPRIRAQLVLSGDPDATDPMADGTHALSEPQTQTCTKGEHHCMFVFQASDATADLGGVLALPCLDDGSCHVGLVMWAWDPQARTGGQDVVLVGENEGDFLANGMIGSDKARLMVVRERGLVDADREQHETSGSGTMSVPTDASARLVYSHRIADALRKDEQLAIEAKLVTAVGGRARISSKLFVTRDPSATEGDDVLGIAPGELGEHNGTNCTAGQSPCTTRKAAVLRASADVDGPIYVNLVVHGAVPGGGATAITVRKDEGWVRSVGYRPQQRG